MVRAVEDRPRHAGRRDAAHGQRTGDRSDAELIELCRVGAGPVATAAFAAFYRRHRNYVLRVAARFSRDRDTTLDALQETFAWLLDRFPPAGDGLSLTGKAATLLYPVARQRALDLRSRAGRDTRGSALQRHAAAPGSDLDALIAAMPDDYREVLELHYLEGWTLTDIAEALAVPPDAVESRIHVAVRELRDDPAARRFFAPGRRRPFRNPHSGAGAMADPDEAPPELPDALIDALRRRDPAAYLVPRDIDEAILSRARGQFATREAAYLPPMRTYWMSAAAAAAILIAGLTLTVRRDLPPAALAADDVDGSGQVDVLDPFALARRNAGHPDAAVEARIETLLARIVSLTPGPK